MTTTTATTGAATQIKLTAPDTLPATTTAPAVVSATTGAVTTVATSLQWTLKSGAIRTAYSEAAQSRAPSVVRHNVADTATLQQLKNGQFGPFLRDVLAACSKGHLIALDAHVKAALTTVIDGVDMVPSGEVLSKSNKATATAFCSFLVAPRATIKGVEQAKPLAKGKLYLSTIAAAWLDSMNPVADTTAAPVADTTTAPVADTTTAPVAKKSKVTA